MTRKDTILISVVINAGLLAILFMTAMIYDSESGNDQMDIAIAPVSIPSSPAQPSQEAPIVVSPTDETDHVLQYYSSEVESDKKEEDLPLGITKEDPKDFPLQVKVKKGDSLEKIAKNHLTTVSAIKKTNHLENEKLSIGQTLILPPKQQNTALDVQGKNGVEETNNESIYYVIKSGDNPWKIAKQYGIKYDEILRLNNLDEEKARNLKIGDRIRVK